MEIVDTVPKLQQFLAKVEMIGKGHRGFQLPPENEDGTETPRMYLTFDPEFEDFNCLAALGQTVEKGRTVKWHDAAPGLINYCSYVPANAGANKFMPMWSLVLWDGTGWIFDYICICRDHAERNNVSLITICYLNPFVLKAAPQEPMGGVFDQLWAFFRDKRKYFSFRSCSSEAGGWFS